MSGLVEVLTKGLMVRESDCDGEKESIALAIDELRSIFIQKLQTCGRKGLTHRVNDTDIPDQVWKGSMSLCDRSCGALTSFCNLIGGLNWSLLKTLVKLRQR